MPTRANIESVSACPPHLPFGDPSQLLLSAHPIGERSATPFFSILSTQTSSPAALPLTLMKNIQSDPGLLAPSSPSLRPLPQCRGPTLVLCNPLAAWALASALVAQPRPPCPLPAPFSRAAGSGLPGVPHALGWNARPLPLLGAPLLEQFPCLLLLRNPRLRGILCLLWVCVLQLRFFFNFLQRVSIPQGLVHAAGSEQMSE